MYRVQFVVNNRIGEVTLPRELLPLLITILASLEAPTIKIQKV